MTQIAKLYAWILANPRSSISFRDFQRLIEAFGFVLDRTAGSHHLYKHEVVPFPVSVQPRGKDAKSYQISQFVAICAKYQLSVDR
ncbi:type II toxin-antitoxin system HicA family toxin [Sphingomonas sp. 4RDLI-65]|uniref:type II toxin-antitoxin system HicA family toxin n=1 Tax=Sphingomonas sp. 4RDLI-65 TaxID=3111641 RepID=UPI003C1F1AA2